VYDDGRMLLITLSLKCVLMFFNGFIHKKIFIHTRMLCHSIETQLFYCS